jgi:oxygen-independent coproporphyrinogen III oxidase
VLGIYIQVPFCQTRCTYCNFHTGVVSSDRFAPYIRAVQREVSSSARIFGIGDRAAGGKQIPRFADSARDDNVGGFLDLGIDVQREFPPSQIVDTVYIGGGTPSLLNPLLLHDLLETVRNSFTTAFEEVTLEADPETITAEKARAWVSSGINRTSFGSQSFVDGELIAAGRMHRAKDIYAASAILREAGIRNVSFDLIAGLPKQTDASWRHSLAETIALSPEHVSIYMMEIDEGSRLGLEVLQSGSRYSARELPSEEAMADFYELAQRELQAAGYEQYEISNWAKPGFASKHNLKYWRREPYLGFGAGAHSFSGTQRWSNKHDAAVYVDAINSNKFAVENVQSLTPSQALEEEFFLGLRQLSGIDLGRIQAQYNIDMRPKIATLASAGLVQHQADTLRLAPSKLNISNEILVELLR